MKQGLATALAVLSVVMMSVACADNGTGSGESDGKQAVSFQVAEVVCPHYRPQRITDNVKAVCQFVSEGDGTIYPATYRSPEVTITSLKPGEYRVIVRSGRTAEPSEMPGLLVVTEAGSTYVQGQLEPSSIPSMTMIDGKLELATEALSRLSDTLEVYFDYRPPADSLGVAAEVEAIKRLSAAMGRRMDVGGMSRVLRFYESGEWLVVVYKIPIDEEVFRFDLYFRCRQYRTANAAMFPPAMDINPSLAMCGIE